jgi:phosphatidylserine/phosphatidylglycerophosphate/cardiolipin synthase-like enzyme
MTPDPLPPQTPPPPPVEGGTHVVQLLRTYPDLRYDRDYPFANGGERSIARGYTKAIERARKVVYVEDQYLWGHRIGHVFTEALRNHPELRIIAVVPLVPDVEGWNRNAQLLGRRRAMVDMLRAGPGRVAFYGIENPQGTPVYVHAKVCVIDDTWASIGSDNFNRRSWTHDSELSAVVVDREQTEDGASAYARRLRLALAAEHLGRGGPAPEDPLEALEELVGDCVDPEGQFAAFEQAATELDAWHQGGKQGPRPSGRLRRLAVPDLGVLTRVAALPPYLLLHDPDGRPKGLRLRGEF